MAQLKQVTRPPGRNNLPLIENFILTGEPTNPWRCGGCLTKAQRKNLDPTPADVRDLSPQPGCCRKCGTDFYR